MLSDDLEFNKQLLCILVCIDKDLLTTMYTSRNDNFNKDIISQVITGVVGNDLKMKVLGAIHKVRTAIFIYFQTVASATRLFNTEWSFFLVSKSNL